ncbi:MAG: hypothetical protein ACP5RP_00935 [Candidatus Micrarchaeia archaeon]
MEETEEKVAKASYIENHKAMLSLAALLLIIIMGIILRTGLLRYQGLFEPDGFYHYAVIKQAIHNGLVIPINSSLSGYPTHTRIGETEGFYYITIIPWLFLRYLGFSVLDVMRLVPIFFGVLDIIGAYYIARLLSKSRLMGILSSFFVAISSGDIARTTGLVYRGDGFVTIFLIFAFYFLAKALEQENYKKTAYYSLISSVLLSFGYLVWNGAPFGTITYMLALVFVIAYAFIKADKKLLVNSNIAVLGMFSAYILQHIYRALMLLKQDQALYSLHYFIFYIPILLAGLIAYAVLEKKLMPALSSVVGRAAFLIVVVLIFIAGVILADGGYLKSIATGYGLVVAGNNLTMTIQELARPTFTFLFNSFGYQLWLAPIGIVAFVLFSKVVEGGLDTKEKIKNYFKNFVSNLNITTGFLILLAYIITTAYLQANAIRFNSLVSVPIAIFSAFAIYTLLSIIPKKGRYERIIPIALIVIFLAYSANLTYIESMASIQADGINPQFLAAMSWLSNNTPTNSTVLAVWPDGSVVEGWANRISIMDSVGGQNPELIANFSKFIFNTTGDTNYLYKEFNKPNYFVVRQYWINELAGIAIEGNIENPDEYGFDSFYNYSERRAGNMTVMFFSNSAFQAEVLFNYSRKGERIIGGVKSGSSSTYYPISHIIFYNTSSMNSQVYNNTGINYSLLIEYNSTKIEGAFLLGGKVYQSNFFKLIYLCNYTYCPFDNSNVTAQLVYENPDTKIFHLIYK